MRRKNELILLLLLFLLTLCVRLFLISKGPYHYDCLELLISSQKTLQTHQLQYMHGAGYPLTVLIGAFFLLVFGHWSPVFAINLIGVIFSTACIPALYCLVRRLLDANAAFFSAVLLSFLPGLLSVSIYGNNNAVSLFFILLSALFMLRALSGKGTFGLAWSGLCLGASAGCRLPDVIFFLPLAVLYFSGAGFNRRSLKDFFLSFLVPFAAVPALLYYPMFARGELKQLLAVPEQMGGKYLGPFSRLLGGSSAIFINLVSPPVLMSALGGLFCLIRENRTKLFYFLLVWFAVTFFFYANISTMEARMLDIAAVPVAVMAGFLLSRVYKIMPAGGALLLAVIAGMMFFFIYPALKFRHDHNFQESFSHWVRKNTPADSVVISGDEWIFLDYYAQRQALHKPWSCDGFSTGDFLGKIDRDLDEGRKVFILESVISTDRCGLFRKSAQQKYRLVRFGWHYNEDWHHACLATHVYRDSLLELKIK